MRKTGDDQPPQPTRLSDGTPLHSVEDWLLYGSVANQTNK